MNIVALKGKSDTGKTSTLKNLIQLFSDFVTIHGLCKPFSKGSETLINASLEEQLASKSDVWVKIVYKNKIIGITTQGDTAEYINEASNYLNDCNVFVCAVHSRGKTLEFVEAEAKKQNGFCYMIQQPHLHNYKETLKTMCDSVNKKQAELLKAILESLLEEV